MKNHTTVLGLLREALFGDPADVQYARVEAAIKAKAQCVSDVEFNRTMANFYTDRVLHLDPHDIDQVWGFADARQKQHDHQTACQKHEQLTAEAQARVDAETQRFKEIK